MRAELEVRLLGGFRVSVRDRPIPDDAWCRTSARSLVKLLSLSEGHRLHREQVTELIWPGLGSDAAAGNLRKAVHYARHALRPDLVLADRDLLILPADRLWVDVDAFDAAVAGRDTEVASELYAGDLLPEDRFEEWTAEPRARLRTRFAQLMLDRADELAGNGDARGAADILERLASADPLNEGVVARLMSVYAEAGQRHLALGWYRQLEQRLADELGVAPDATVRQLRARIADSRPAPTAASTHAGRTVRPRPPAERKPVTVVLAELFEQPYDVDVEVAQSGWDRWLRVASGVLEVWGGTARPLVGGGVLAVFGLPAVHEDDPARALRAGLHLVEQLGPQVRVCAATGEILAPAGATTDPRDIAGEALDAVLELRAVARPGGVVATDRTYHGAGPGFRAQRLGGGRRLIRAADPAPSRPTRRTPMVGRTSERAVFAAVLDAVADTRSPRLLTVVGAAGVGKTRFVAEAVATARSARAALTVWSGRCVPVGQDVTYAALGEIVRQACRISIGDPPTRSADRLRSALRSILATVPSRAGSDAAIHALAIAAGVPLSDNLPDLAPRQVHEELARAWPLFASGCARDQPAIFVLEDLHWASPALLDIVELIVARASGAVLVIGTARPDLAAIRPGFGVGVEGFSAISLPPLDKRESRELLDALRAPAELPEPRRRELLARAEGNPLFLEQLVLHLDDHDERDLPDSLHGLLSARIDAVSPAARRVLHWAAVIGRVFWADAIERALPDHRVRDLLGELERRGLIAARTVPTWPGQAEFAFRHVLVRDVAYASMPKADRARAHAQIGTWLADLGLTDESVIELLAHHFGEAAGGEGAALAFPDPSAANRVRRSAFTHLLAAGVIARRRYELAAATDLHRRCQAFAASPEDSVAAAEALAEDQAAAFHGDAARACYLDALAAVRDPAAEARLCRKLAGLMAGIPGAFHDSPEPDAVEALIARGLHLTNDEAETAWLLLARGMSARLWRGSEPFGQGASARPDPIPIQDRIADVERAARIAQRLNHPEMIAQADDTLRVLYGIAGRYPAVLTTARRGLARLNRIRSRLEQADVLRNAAVAVMWIAGDYRQGLGLSVHAHELSLNTNPHQLMHATWPYLLALYELGRWAELEDILGQHIAAFDAEPAVACHFVRDGPLIGATAFAHRGQHQRATQIAARVGDPLADVATASAWQSRYAVAIGAPATARMISQDKSARGGIYGPQHALALVEALVALEDWPELAAIMPAARAAAAGNALLTPLCERAEGILASLDGQHARAAGLLRAALAEFERLQIPFEQARTLKHLSANVAGPEGDRLRAQADQIGQRLGIADR